MGGAAHTRFNASLKGIAAGSAPASFGGFFAVDIKEYYLALGQFITGFSTVEKALLQVVWKEAGLSSPLAPAIMHGLRVTGAIEALTRIHEANGTTIHPQLAHALKQLAVINTSRNWIVHWGVNLSEPQSPKVTNDLTSHCQDSLRGIPVSVNVIERMFMDLGGIDIALMFCLYGNEENGFTLDSIETPTWLYKFPQSKATQAKNPKKRDTRKPQR